MNTYSVARCISALVLVIAASVIGMPLPASASGEGKVVVSRHQALTINGRPLAQLLSATATARGAVPLPGLLEQVDGQISGVVVDAAGRPVAEHAVQLMRLFTLGGNPAEQISGTRMTDAEGGFSFTGLQPSDYEIKVLVADEVIASAAVTLAPGAMQVRGVAVVRPATQPTTLAVWDGTVLNSFEALQPVLEVGQRVTLSDDILDSRWKGLVIGTAVGAAALGLAWGSYAAVPGAMLGAGIGYTIDYYSYGGTRVTGKVVSISGDQLVISRRRALFRSEELAFTEDVVRSIRIVDSEWNGLLLGAAPGIALLFVSCSGADASDYCGVGPFFVTGIGMLVGGAIDELMTQPVYERQSHAPRVTISPLLGRERMGLLARVQF